MLLIDVGNSCIKWAEVGPGGLLREGGRLHHEGGSVLPQALCRAWSSLAPARVVVASVAKRGMRAVLEQWCVEHWGVVPVWLERPPCDLSPLSSAYAPGKLGVDRWLALVAARPRAPVWVIDCGTAVTIDLLDEQGRHEGGLILPGLKLMAESLARETRLPLRRPESPRGGAVVATSTEEAIGLGVVAALAGAIERTVGRHPGYRRLLTGGDAEAIQPHLEREYDSDPQLVLRGLQAIASQLFARR